MRKTFIRFNFLLAFALFTQSFGGANPAEVFAHFAAAVKNKGQVQYFAVIKVADLTRGTMREICAPGSFIRAALHKELGYDYDNQSVAMVEHVALMNLDRIFEFKNADALTRLGVDTYTDEELAQIEKDVNFSALARQIRKWGTWKMEFKNDDKQMLLYAHALFNQGILTGEDSKDLGTLLYIPN